MKPTSRLRLFLSLSGSSLLAISSSQSANLYWDTDGTAAGLGNAAGTWGASAFVGNTLDNVIWNGAAATAATVTTSADSIYFGTNNLALGSTASTIAISASGVTINTIVFGTAQGSQGVTLSGGGGIINLAGNAPSATPTITANNTGTNTIGAVLAGTVGLVKAGPGTLVLTGSNTFTGGLTIAGGGTLQIGNGTSGSLTSQALTFNNGGGTFNVQAASAGSTQAMGALTFSTTGVGDSTVRSTYGSSGNAALTFSSLAARGAGATGNFVVSGGTNGTTNKIVLTGATTGTLLDKGYFFGGNRYAAYDAGGFVRAYGAGDASYLAAPTGATIGASVAASNVDLTTGDITAQTTISANTINMRNFNIAMTGTSQVLSTNGLLSSGSGSATIGGGTTPLLQTSTANAEMVIRVDGASDQLTISSGLQNNGTTPLTKSGAGTLVLSGANTYSGTTTINSGILAVSGGSAIANTGAVVLANAAGATFQLNGSETIGNLSGGGFSGGNVNVGSNTLTIADNTATTFGGKFIGSGAVTKTGNGQLTLSNVNSFAGALNINAGSVAFTYGNNVTTNPAPTSSGGLITMAGGTTLIFQPTANVAGGVPWHYMNSNTTAGFTVSNAINVSSGTATIQTAAQNGGAISYNEVKWNFSGGVTGGTSGSQTLAIHEGGFGGTGGGDRQSVLFSGVIANGSGGTLGVSVDFKGASGTSQGTYVNLSAQNTFSGPITTINSKALIPLYTGASSVQGGFLVIGGERFFNGTPNSFGGVIVGSGTLGTTAPGTGNYTNTISLATGTFLDYASSANQTLGGAISGGGAVLIEGAGAGTLTLSGGNSYTGGTFVNSGTLLVSGANNLPGTGALDVRANGTFSLADGTARTTTANGGLTLTSGANLVFDWNGASADSLTTSATVTPGTAVVGIGINKTGSPSGGPHTLITGGASSTLNTASYYLANAIDFSATLGKTATTVTINGFTSQTALTNIYWTGNKLAAASTALVDNAWALSDGTKSNWSSTTTAYTATPLTPGSTANVIFANGQVGKAQQSTVLGANITANSVTIDDGTAVTIAGAGNTLTLLSTSSTAGTVASPGSAISVTANAGNPTISTNLVLGASQTWNVASGKTLTVSGTVSGLGFDLTKADTGTLVLSGLGNYSGITTVSAGTMQFTNQTSLYGGNTANWTAANIKVNSGATLALNVGAVSALNTTQFTPASVTTLLTNLGGLGGAVSNNGLQSGSAIGFDTSNAAGNIFTIADNIADSTGVGGGAIGVTKLGTNTLVLSGANTYTGATTIAAGTLRVSSSAALGSASNTLVFRGGTLQAGAAFTSVSTRGVTMTGAGTIDTNGNAMTIAGAFSGTGLLTKSGLGTLTLSNTLGHTGGTTISAGTLLVSGANNLPATGNLTVSANTIFSLADGTARTTTGASTGVGLSLATGSILAFDWDGASRDSLTLSGTATANSTGNVGIIINGINSPSGSGNLISTVAGSTLNTANYFLANNTNYTATITKAANSVSIGSYASATALTNAYWKGGLTGAVGTMAFSTGAASNWATNAAGTATALVPGGSGVNVIFGATGATNQSAVTTGADMNLGSITFNDSSAITIAGSNIITLNSTSATAATTTAALATVTAGSAISVTSFANATNTISANLALGANQTWNIANAKTLNVSGIVSGTGNLTKADAGTLALTGANTYTGSTTIAAGILTANSTSALGNETNINNTLIFSGGTLRATGAFTSAASRAVTLNAAGGTIDTNGNALTIAGSIGGTGSLTKSGTNTLILNNASNSYSGGTVINAGILSVSSDAHLGNSAGGVTLNGGQLTVASANMTSTRIFTINAGGGTVQVSGNNNLTTTGKLTGSGTITHIDPGGGGPKNVNFNATNNDFTGGIVISTGTNSGTIFTVNSLTDSANNIVFNGTGANAANSFVHGTGGITALTLKSRAFELNSGATNMNSTISNANTSNGITIGTNLVATGAGAKVLILDAAAGPNNLFAGTITNGSGGGTVALSKTGAGIWSLTNASNSYSAGTTVSNGTLRFASGALGTTGTINASGGTLQWLAGNTQDISSRLAMTLGTTTTLNTGGNNVTFSNAIGSANTSILTKTGSGTLTLQAASTNTGGTNVNGGTLLLSGAINMPATGTLAVAAGGNFSLADGTVRNTTAAALTLASGSLLTFDWSSAGTVDNLTPAAAIAPGAVNIGIQINPIGTPTGGGNLLTTTQAGSNLNAPSYFLANNTNFTATITKPAGAGAGSVSIGSYASVTALTDAYWKRNVVTGATDTMAFSLGALSNWATNAAGTSAGGVVPGGGTTNVIFGNTSASSAVTVGADMNIGSLTFNDTAAVTINGNNLITLNNTSGTAASTTAALATVTAGSAISVTSFANATNTINANLALGANQTWNVASAKTLVVNGTVFGTGSLTKGGTGQVNLTTANFYTGGTTISAGTVRVTNSLALSTGDVSVAAGGKLFLDANSLTLANNITLNGTTTDGAIYSGQQPGGNVANLTGQITLNSTSNISTWWNDKTLQLSGKITGAGGLDFVLQPSSVGGRYFITGATNDYAGATSVTGSATGQFGYSGQAMLYLGANNALPTTSALTLNNADLYLNGYSQSLPSISGTGSFAVKNGSTTAATLSLGAGNTTSTFSGTIQDNGILVTNTSTTPATVTGTVSFTKIGTGTVTFTGANSYSGATTINAGGTLQLGNAGTTGSLTATNSITNNGNLTINRSNAFTQASDLGAGVAITGTGSFTQAGSGTTTLTATNTYTGNTTVSAGTLEISGTGRIYNAGTPASATLVSVSSGAQITLSGSVNNALGFGANETWTVAGTINSTGGAAQTMPLTVNLNNGTLSGTTNATFGTYLTHAGNTNTITANGGSNVINSGNFGLAGSSTLAVNTPLVTDALSISSTIGAAIANTGALTKSGLGTLTLSGTSNYTGNTSVNAGTLVINGSISTSLLTTVASGATIQGTGTTGALTVQSGGSINPGSSPGTLDVIGNYTQAGLYTADIEGLAAGDLPGNHDLISVQGAVNITGGSLTALFNTFTPVNGDLIFILLNDGTDAITGTYAGLAQGATVTTYGGFTWQISYNADSASNTFTGTPNGNDIALMAVPEPRVALLGGLGLLMLLRNRRNK